MTHAFLNRCLTPRRLFRASRTRTCQHYLAILFFGLFAGAAMAQNTLTYADGDLFLGFRSTDGTSDYLVNIGQPAQFVNASSGATVQVSVGGLSADLTAAFGSDWYSRVDPNTGNYAVSWAIVGGRQVAAANDPANTLYSSNPSRSAWPRQSETAQSFSTSLIAALGNNFSGNQSSANNPQGLIQGAASTNSYAAFQPGGARSSGISFQTWNPSNEARPVARLFFDRITPGSGASTVLGAFTLNSSGQLTFSAGANAVGQALNIATRMNVLAADNALIGGFIVTGTQPKKVVVRGLGPSLSRAPFNLSGTLADPTIELHDSSVTLASNDNWQDDPVQAAEISAAGFAPNDTKESVIIRTLTPGNYTVILRGKQDTTGIGIVEVYDLDPAANSQLANISTRGFVDSGDNVMIGGFIVGPGSALAPRVLIRAIGPSLTGLGIANALQDPFLELHDGNGTTVQSNDDWQATQQQDLVATGLAPTDTHESAIIATVPPGPYTAIVKGKAGAVGVALVEIYNLQ